MKKLMNVRIPLAAAAVAMFGALALFAGAASASDGPSIVSAPTINGAAAPGETLSAGSGTWSGDTSGGFSYQWQDCDSQGSNCNPISGATSSTYMAQDSDIGATISVEVTALDHRRLVCNGRRVS